MTDPLLISTIDAIADYKANYRRHDFPDFEISGLYDLTPEKPRSCTTLPAHNWPNAYPHPGRAGVYLIFSDSLQLLYVGKASMGSSIPKRLQTYFRYGKIGEMVLHHSTWSQPPRFFYVVAVPEGYEFEAPALEEFLIRRLHPLNNSVGRRQVK
jgi:hypothetical protein